MNEIIAIVLGSNAVTVIVTAIITALNNRKGRLKAIEEKQDELIQNQKTAEKDALRTQLLLMIADYPEEKTEILKLSQHYFKDLKGNWTATAIFNTWLEKYCEGAKPEWFQN